MAEIAIEVVDGPAGPATCKGRLLDSRLIPRIGGWHDARSALDVVQPASDAAVVWDPPLSQGARVGPRTAFVSALAVKAFALGIGVTTRGVQGLQRRVADATSESEARTSRSSVIPFGLSCCMWNTRPERHVNASPKARV